MTDRQKAEILGRRGELLAELFLQELHPEFVARPASDLGYDFFVGFSNADGGLNIAAVEVRTTERPVQQRHPVEQRLFRRLANSNLPVLLLVVNVKENRLFYALPALQATEGDADAGMVSISVTPIDEAAKHELRSLLTTPHAVAA